MFLIAVPVHFYLFVCSFMNLLFLLRASLDVAMCCTYGGACEFAWQICLGYTLTTPVHTHPVHAVSWHDMGNPQTQMELRKLRENPEGTRNGLNRTDSCIAHDSYPW